jgi:hypothetical protein
MVLSPVDRVFNERFVFWVQQGVRPVNRGADWLADWVHKPFTLGKDPGRRQDLRASVRSSTVSSPAKDSAVKTCNLYSPIDIEYRRKF